MAPVHRSIDTDEHGSKFEAHEPAASKPDAFLPEEDRTRRHEPNQSSNQNHQRQQDRCRQKDQPTVQNALPHRSTERIGKGALCGGLTVSRWVQSKMCKAPHLFFCGNPAKKRSVSEIRRSIILIQRPSGGGAQTQTIESCRRTKTGAKCATVFLLSRTTKFQSISNGAGLPRISSNT